METFSNFNLHWKKAYLAELFLVAASAENKNLSKVKYCSKGHLLRYRRFTLDNFFFSAYVF